jgi:hypothetical protein
MLAGRETTPEQRAKIILAKKNIFMKFAQELEKSGRKTACLKFYEHLVKMDIDNIEKEQIKSKLRIFYSALGMFREAKLLE